MSDTTTTNISSPDPTTIPTPINPSNSLALLKSLLTTTETAIIPLTAVAVGSGSKLFGAAILHRPTHALVTAATNNERVSPLLHGEINCIQSFFQQSASAGRPPPPPTKECIFFATHEPCSLCLSGITWAGFNEFYYLFTYEDSRDRFGIPYDIQILQEVYQVRGENETVEDLERKPLYNRTNRFFRARSVADLIKDLHVEERGRWEEEVRRVKGVYDGLSETYQKGKTGGTETSAVFR